MYHSASILGHDASYRPTPVAPVTHRGALGIGHWAFGHLGICAFGHWALGHWGFGAFWGHWDNLGIGALGIGRTVQGEEIPVVDHLAVAAVVDVSDPRLAEE
eukprot:scaffold49179_cov49-Phaeocystis_antarctica.AAC.1